MLNLMDVAKENGEDDKQKAYWNIYYCLNRVTSVCKSSAKSGLI